MNVVPLTAFDSFGFSDVLLTIYMSFLTKLARMFMIVNALNPYRSISISCQLMT